MRTAYRDAYGGPETLSVREVPRPVPAPNDVLVRVQWATVNRTDCGALWGAPYVFRFFVGWPRPRHAATGADFAGTVEAVGSAVSGFRAGDRVLGFDDNCVGAHAEFVRVPEKGQLVLLPDDVDLRDAAALIEGAHYAYNFCRKITLGPGVNVLVNGATGAIGWAAVQLVRHFGATVTAVCGSAHVETVRELGVLRVIDYEREDFTRLLEPGSFDFVLDAVGKSRFSLCKPLLKPRGAYVSSELGPGLENLRLALTTPLTGGKRVIFPVPIDVPRSLSLVRDLLQKKELRPLIDRTYSLDRIAEAYDYVSRGKKLGAVLLDPWLR
jgi:NADPH:quinone reductase-like Zn-dependent oxidoreductase